MNYYVSSPESTSAGSYYENGMYGYANEPVSPTLLSDYTGSAKLRQDACRGFDALDDQEFCPALTSHVPRYSQAGSIPTFVPGAYSMNAAATATATTTVPTSATTSPQAGDSSSSSGDQTEAVPLVTVRERKALAIIDPATGLRVSRW